MRKAHVVSAGLMVAVLGCGDDPTTPPPPAEFDLEVAIEFPELDRDDFPRQLAFEGDGTLWVTTFQGGIIRITDGERTRFEADVAVGGTRPNDLFIDAADRVWVTAGEHLAVYQDGTWTPQTPPSRMGLDPLATQVAVNGAGDVLLGVGTATAGGLLLRRGGDWQVFTVDGSALPSPITHAIEVGPDGNFWVGSAAYQGHGGVSRVAGGQLTSVATTADGLLYDWIDDLTVTDGVIYLAYKVMLYDEMGPDGGLQAISPQGDLLGTWLPHETELVSSRVIALAYTGEGELWFTTGLDHHRGACGTCFSGVSVIDAHGRAVVRSALNADLVENEYFPDIAVSPDGQVYVIATGPDQILRVVR